MRNPASKNESTEKAVRAIFRKHTQSLGEVFLNPATHQTMEHMIRGQIAFLEIMKREAARKKRSKRYLRWVQAMLADSATAELGPLLRLKSDQLDALDQILGGTVNGLLGRDAFPGTMDPNAFIALQKKVFVQLRKRGPKNSSRYDVACLRSIQGESISSIARDMDPEGFRDDPMNAIQKYSRAIARRKKAGFQP